MEILLFSLFSGGAFFLQNLHNKDIKALKGVSFKFMGIKLTGIDVENNRTIVTVIFKLINPSDIKVKFSNFMTNIKFGENIIALVNRKVKTEINPKEEKDLGFKFTVDNAEFINTLISPIKGDKLKPLQLIGNMKFTSNTFGQSFDAPINETIDLSQFSKLVKP